jgi:hypothetical protein
MPDAFACPSEILPGLAADADRGALSATRTGAPARARDERAPEQHETEPEQDREHPALDRRRRLRVAVPKAGPAKQEGERENDCAHGRRPPEPGTGHPHAGNTMTPV